MKMAKDNKTKRKYIENLFYNVFDQLDKSKDNTNMYIGIFDNMSDTEFFKLMKSMMNEEVFPMLETETFNREPKPDDIEDAAKVLNIPLFEKVVRYDEDLKEYVSTDVPVPVGYLIQRRVQQMVVKKNSVTDNIYVRNSKTGQVTGDSKTARDSDMENYILSILEADEIMKELLGFRADDMEAKQDAYTRIARDGYVSLEDLPNDVKNKTSLNTLDKYFISAGLKTDLTTPGLMLRYTMDNKEMKDLTRSSVNKTN